MKSGDSGIPRRKNVVEYTGLPRTKGSQAPNGARSGARSFFATLKKDLVHPVRFRTRASAQVRLFEYMEMFYNPKRSDSSLGGRVSR